MHILEILETGEKLEFPGKVAELNSAQYEAFCKLFVMHQDGTLNQDQFIVELVYLTLEIPKQKKLKHSMNEEYQLLQNVAALSETLLSFWQVVERDDKQILAIDWYHEDQKLPIIKWKELELHGPKALGEDLTYGEYVNAHEAFKMYLQNPLPVLLDKLVATLWRPLQPAGFFLHPKRMSLQDVDMEMHLKEVTDLPYHLKYASFIWWSCFEEFIPSAVLPTDAGEVSISKLFEKSPEHKGEPSLTGVRGVLYELAESHVFGTTKEVEGEYFWHVMLRLYQLREQAEEKRRHMERMKHA
jgi:hypothetical protein